MNVERAGGQPFKGPPGDARSLRRITMKTVISAVVALSVLSGYATSAFADNVPQSIWEQLDRDGRGGHLN
jgi:hypothetical protein